VRASARSAWAVGRTGTSKTLILRWNGSAWKRVPSPTPTGGGNLRGVAATSARNAWAVGASGTGKTLILRWNGSRWKQVASPTPGPSGATLTKARRRMAPGWRLPRRGY
jgi:hypothetical protein